MPLLQQLPPGLEWLLPQVTTVDFQCIVQPDMGRIGLEHLGRYALSVEPLLQILERRDLAVTQHQKLAIEHGIEAKRRDQFGESSD